MRSALEYLAKADQCERMARDCADGVARQMFLKTAVLWRALAKTAIWPGQRDSHEGPRPAGRNLVHIRTATDTPEDVAFSLRVRVGAWTWQPEPVAAFAEWRPRVPSGRPMRARDSARRQDEALTAKLYHYRARWSVALRRRAPWVVRRERTRVVAVQRGGGANVAPSAWRSSSVAREDDPESKAIKEREQAVAQQRLVVRRLTAIGADTAPAKAVLKMLEEALAAARWKSR
jgi:hypothetical protein